MTPAEIAAAIRTLAVGIEAFKTLARNSDFTDAEMNAIDEAAELSDNNWMDEVERARERAHDTQG